MIERKKVKYTQYHDLSGFMRNTLYKRNFFCFIRKKEIMECDKKNKRIPSFLLGCIQANEYTFSCILFKSVYKTN